MAAAVLSAFGRVAPAAPLINLVAVPWVSSVMVPSALLGRVLSPLPGIGLFVWWCFEQALQVFHQLLVIAGCSLGTAFAAHRQYWCFRW